MVETKEPKTPGPDRLDQPLDQEQEDESIFSSFEESPSREWLKIALVGIGVLVVVVLIARTGYRYLFKRSKESDSSRQQQSAMGSLLSPTSEPDTAESAIAPNGDSGSVDEWQAFTKKYQNYTVRVPPDWKIEVHRHDLKMAAWTYFFPPGISAYPVEIGTDYIAYQRQKGQSVRECIEYWLNKHLSLDSQIRQRGPFVEKREDLIVSEREAVKYTVAFSTSGRKDIWIYVPKENKKKDDYDYIFKIIARDVNDDLLEKFNQMVESFKFLEEEEVEKIIKEEEAKGGE